MAAEQRRLLEKLMAAESSTAQVSLMDKEICRPYCVQFCTHDVFELTKYQIGPCPRVHSDRMRLQYQARGPYAQFESSFRAQLDRAIEDCNRRIVNLEEKLKPSPEIEAQLDDINSSLREISEDIDATKDEISALGQEGLIEAAIERLEHLRSLEAQQRNLKSRSDQLSDTDEFSTHQSLQVCTICGSLLSRLDTDIRLAQHFSGKTHLGYAQVRDARAELDNGLDRFSSQQTVS